MSVEFDAASYYHEDVGGTTVGGDHTVTNLGSGRLLLIGISGVGGTSPSVSGVDCGGDAASQMPGASHNSAGVCKEVWYLFAPITGTITVTVTFSESVNRSEIAIASYTGVNVSSAAAAFGTLQESDTSTGSISTPVSSQVGELVTDFILYHSNSSSGGGTNFAVTGSTQIHPLADHGPNGSGSVWSGADISHAPGATSVTMSWTYDSAGTAHHFALTLHAASPLKNRAIDYISNTYQSRAAGRTVILDALGRDVPPEQIQQDKWLRVDGPAFVSSYRYGSNIDDPSVYYSESVSLGDSLSIKTDRQSLLESLLGRLGGRSI